MKLIAIDMDGTLLHAEKYISSYTIDVIKKMKEEKHRFIVATGRGLKDAKRMVSEAGIPADGYVCANGAVLANANGGVLKEEALDINIVAEIAAWLQAREYYFHLSTSNGAYATDKAYQFFLNDLEEYARHTEHPEKMKTAIRDQADQQIKKIGLGFLPKPEDVYTLGHTLYKFLVLSLFPQRLEEIQKIWGAHPEIALTSSGRNNIELMPPTAEKGKGILYMAKRFGIAPENTVAIGDSYNDVSMFQAAGVSIAMGNADQSIKELTHYETAHNNDDGLAKAIVHHILNKKSTK